MSRRRKVIGLAVVVVVVIALGIALAPSVMGSLGEAMVGPPPPPPPPPPVASFNAQPTLGEAPMTVSFTDRSSYGGDFIAQSWDWDFGDGQHSTLQNPTHTYYAEGFYRVELTTTVTVETPADDNGGETVLEEITDTYYADVVIDAGAGAGRLTVCNLSITPTYAQPGQAVTINADVFNGGGGPAAMTVNLVINGQFEQSRAVSVSPATACPVSFTVYKTTPATYAVSLGDAVGWFYVMQPQ
jgi:PKD repeat protein